MPKQHQHFLLLLMPAIVKELLSFKHPNVVIEAESFTAEVVRVTTIATTEAGKYVRAQPADLQLDP